MIPLFGPVSPAVCMSVTKTKLPKAATPPYVTLLAVLQLVAVRLVHVPVAA